MRVFSLDRAEAVDSIRDGMQAVKHRCPEIDRVILFGSLARGDAVPGSDADVLVLLRETHLPFQQRFAQHMPSGVAMGVDVFAYTHAELESMRNSGNPFIARVLREGIELI